MNTPDKTYCVIGDPIGHSLSPQIHHHVFSSLNLDLYYDKVHVLNDNLLTFCENSKRLNRPGFNVTIPHKKAIMKFLDDIDPLARQTGAVNTVRLKDGKLYGYNTDVYGFSKALLSVSNDPIQKAVILGAGGASRAVTMALISLKVQEMVISDLDENMCYKIREEFEPHYPVRFEIVRSDSAEMGQAIAGSQLLVNATPVGMWPRSQNTPVAAEILKDSAGIVFDLVPNPIETRLLKEAKQCGHPIVPGLSMLIHQALKADEIWLDREIPQELYGEIFTQLSSETEDAR